MHIVYVAAGYPHIHGGGGGAGTYIRLVGRELTKRNHHVTVVTGWCQICPATFNDDGIVVHRLGKTKNLHWYCSKIPFLRRFSLSVRHLERGFEVFQKLCKINRAKKIDLIEFTEGGDFFHAIFRLIPFVAHLHGSQYTITRISKGKVDTGVSYQRILELFLIRKAEWIFSPSQWMFDAVASEAQSELKNHTILSLPVDPELQGLRNEYSEGLKVFFAARNDPIKGGEVLINAVKIVNVCEPGLEYNFFGYEEKSDIELPANVTLHPFVQHDLLFRQLKKSAICVVPSFFENSPNIVYEAMAAGKPVVASCVGGIPELVLDGETGFLVPPGDPPALADAILALARDEPLRRKMGAKAKQVISELADLKKNVDIREAIYERIIAEHRK